MEEASFEEKFSADLQWCDNWMMIRDCKTATGESKYPNLIIFVGILAS